MKCFRNYEKDSPITKTLAGCLLDLFFEIRNNVRWNVYMMSELDLMNSDPNLFHLEVFRKIFVVSRRGLESINLSISLPDLFKD